MTDLVTFLGQRLDEDEAAAIRAQKKRRGPWCAFRWRVQNVPPTAAPAAMDRGSVAQAMDDRLAGHIARHDPARVLREVEAKRKILAAHDAVYEDPARYPCDTVRALAAVYSDHPDYQQEWA